MPAGIEKRSDSSNGSSEANTATLAAARKASNQKMRSAASAEHVRTFNAGAAPLAGTTAETESVYVQVQKKRNTYCNLITTQTKRNLSSRSGIGGVLSAT